MYINFAGLFGKLHLIVFVSSQTRSQGSEQSEVKTLRYYREKTNKEELNELSERRILQQNQTRGGGGGVVIVQPRLVGLSGVKCGREEKMWKRG